MAWYKRISRWEVPGRTVVVTLIAAAVVGVLVAAYVGDFVGFGESIDKNIAKLAEPAEQPTKSPSEGTNSTDVGPVFEVYTKEVLAPALVKVRDGLLQQLDALEGEQETTAAIAEEAAATATRAENGVAELRARMEKVEQGLSEVDNTTVKLELDQTTIDILNRMLEGVSPPPEDAEPRSIPSEIFIPESTSEAEPPASQPAVVEVKEPEGTDNNGGRDLAAVEPKSSEDRALSEAEAEAIAEKVIAKLEELVLPEAEGAPTDEEIAAVDEIEMIPAEEYEDESEGPEGPPVLVAGLDDDPASWARNQGWEQLGVDVWK